MSWRLEETCCHSNSSERPSAKTDVKNYKGVKNNNNKGRGKKNSKKIETTKSGNIRKLEEKENYKHLRTLEANAIKQAEMKRKNYIRIP